MFSVLKFIIGFVFCFLLLSVPLEKKPLFYWLEKYSKPYTQKVFQELEKAFNQESQKTKNVQESSELDHGEPADNYSEDDQKKVDEIIKRSL